MNRGALADALLRRLQDLDVFKSSSRRLKMWVDVPAADRPAVFLIDREDVYLGASPALRQRDLLFEVWVYIDTKDPGVIGADVLDGIMDKIDAALAPAGADLAQGLQTLSGLAAWCIIDGNVLKDPGDLDGDGILVVPLRVRVPV